MYSYSYKNFDLAGLNLRRDKIPYSCGLADHSAGGIRTNATGGTTVPALYVASVATDHSEDGVTNIILHGIEFVIGGYRSCKAAAKYASENEELPIIEYQAELIKEDKYATLKRKSGLKHPEVKKQCMAIMGEGLLGPTRNDKNPKEAIKAAGEIRKNEIPMISAKDYHEMARRIGLGNELRLLEILPKCTLIRTESRGSHYRENYPGKSDHNWLKWGIVKREGDLIKN